MKNLLDIVLRLLPHKHRWNHKQRGVGIFQKGAQNIHFNARGFIAWCACCPSRIMFIPDNLNLNPVEVES